MKRIVYIAVTAVLLSASAGFARTMNVDDVLNMKSIEAVSLSPDGSTAAVVLKSAIVSSNTWVSEIYLVQTDGKSNIFLARGYSPKWSPDGRSIAFVKSIDGTDQIVIRQADGTNEEALAGIPKGVTRFAWSPDGKQMAFIANIAVTNSTVSNGPTNIIIADNGYREYPNLWVLELSGTNTRQVTSGKFFINSFDWSPDGESLAIAGQPTPKDDDGRNSRVYIAQTNGGLRELVVPGYYGALRFSPDGNSIACLSRNNPRDWLEQYRIKIIDIRSNKIIRAVKDGTEDISGLYDWTPDGKSLYFQREKGLTYQVCRLDLSTGKTEQLTAGNSLWENVSFDGNFQKTAYTKEDPENPSELYFSGSDFRDPRKLTFWNEGLKALELGKTEIYHWKNGKQSVEGILIKPVNFDQKKKYPLLVVLHGGPTSCFSLRFLNGRWAYPTQVFAGMDYLVLLPNPRGSSGYGDKFRKGNRGDWGGRDYRDVMAGVRSLTAVGIADKSRMGVMGWSYGGYLSAWVVSQTNAFKAASVGAGITDLYSLYGTIDIPEWMESFYAGAPYSRERVYLEHSPIYYSRNLKTPTLIQHGEKDTRVPLSQSWELKRALDKMGVSNRLVIYPKQGHVPSDISFRKESMERNIEWFNQWLKE